MNPSAPDPDRDEVNRGRSPPNVPRRHQDSALDSHDESREPSSDAKDSRRSFSPPIHRPHRNTGGAFICKLFEDAKHRDGTEKSSSVTLEPDVLYVAQVSDVDSTTKPLTVQYQHSKPLAFDRVANEKKISSSIDSDPSRRKDFRAAWTGPIITIQYWAKARFPRQPERLKHYSKALNQEGVQTHTWFDDFDALSFKSVTQSRLYIQSPFLHRRLRSLAGYYPSFFDADFGSFNDVNLTHWTDAAISKQIPEPWSFLLHRFSLIEASVNDVGSNDAQTNPPDDAAGSIANLETEHTRQLYRFLKPHYEDVVEPIVAQLAETSPQLPFDLLWYIFAPGTDVYLSTENSFQAMVVERVRSSLEMREGVVPMGSERTDSPGIRTKLNFWSVDLWYLDAVGSKVGRVGTSIRLWRYEGTRPIKSLAACPTSIWDRSDGGSRRSQIMDRSKLLLRRLKAGHLLANYNGPVEGTNRHYSGAVVIDPERGFSMSPDDHRPVLGRVNDSCASKHFEDYDNINIEKYEKTAKESWIPEDFNNDEDPISHERNNKYSNKAAVSDWSSQVTGQISVEERGPQIGAMIQQQVVDEECTRQNLTDHQLLLLDPKTRAFALKTKTWLPIFADYASEVTQSDDSIQHLVLDDDELKTIKALSTRQYSKRDAWAADFIEGKGTGQIVLLHGPPGVGKTYTVEAIAEYLGRPLLSLTVADIGTVETRVERELLKWFVLAESWDAILLVDEADIFLERRQNRDLARNGLVSAFLRRMEYFQGLLFLTTNRVGQIDDAFISRVHIAIGYGALSPESRAKIWQGFFRKLAKERVGRIQVTPKAKQWVLDKAASGEAQLNGRDIRNALQTAITLAEAEYNEDEDFDPEKTTVVVDQSHFARVLDITNKFHSYVQSIRREDERKRAAGRMDRNDYWINQELQRGSTSL